MMNEKCKCGHTKMYHSVMGRCQHPGEAPRSKCRCIEFTALDSLQPGYPVISADPNKTVEIVEC